MSSVLRNYRKIYTTPGADPSMPGRVSNLETNEYKVTYYQVVTGTSGTLTVPSGGTINPNEFGLSGNAILSKIDVNGKPTFESPTTSGGSQVTASLNVLTGAWVASGVYTSSSVALIYSIKIKGIDYHNLVYNNIIETVKVTADVSTINLQSVTDGGSITTHVIETDGYVKTGGLSTQFLKADGSIDSNTYLTSGSISGFVPYTGATADLNLGTYNLTADHIALNVSPSGAGFVVGATQWNNTIGSSETLLKGGNVVLKNGVDLVARIVNKVVPNTTLTKAAYQVVRVSGAVGGRLAVELAQANSDLNSADTLGVAIETIATNQEGFIITVGQLLEVDTTGSLQGETWIDGDVLYLSPSTPGKITNIKPIGATGHIVVLGYVEYAHAIHGAIYIKIMNGWELDELHNVYINHATLANNDILTFESSTSLWKPKTVVSALGFTPYNATNPSGYITGINSSMVTTALGFTPYNATNPDGFISGITSGMVITALGFTPYNSTNPSGYITGITSGNVTTALGYTPYNATNPSGYITSSALSTYVPYTGATANVNLGTYTLVSPLHESTSNLSLNATGSVLIKSYNAQLVTFATNSFTFTPILVTSGFTPTFTFTKPNNTGQTASTSIAGWNYNGGTRQWLTGAITTQSENVWGATTYSFVGASTITNAYGNVFNAPIAGTNATITNNYAARFNGNVVIGSTGQLIEIKQTANAPTYTQTGATSSIFRLNSGTRRLSFENYSSDNNYLISTGGSSGFTIRTTDSKAINIDTNNIQRFVFGLDGNFYISEGGNYVLGTTTGTKFGNATTQKIAFWNAIPIVQPANTTSLNGVLENTGLMASGSTISTINKPLVVGANTTPRTGVATDGVTSVLGNLQNFTTNYHSGEVLYNEVSGEALNFGQLCYRNAAGKWQKATGSSSTIAAYNMLGICLQTVGATDTAISILTRGYVESTYLSAGAVGNPLFMDATTAGSITNTAPSTAGNVVRIIGNVFWSSALQTNNKWIVYFNPDNTWIEL